MKSEKLLRAMNDLPEDLIAEGNVRRRHPLIRIAAVAVCVLLLVSGLYPYFRGRGQSGDTTARGVVVNGACYEICAPGSTVAQQTGLPDVIEEEMMGLQAETIEQGTVHPYLPVENQRAVYILEQEDGTLQYLIFTGYYMSDDNGNAHVEADQMFLTYGVTGPEGLTSVSWEEETVTDEAFLTAFFQTLADLSGDDCYGQLDFEEQLDDGQGGITVWIEADSGLRWSGSYSETTGVFSWCGNHYLAGPGLLNGAVRAAS